MEWERRMEVSEGMLDNKKIYLRRAHVTDPRNDRTRLAGVATG